MKTRLQKAEDECKSLRRKLKKQLKYFETLSEERKIPALLRIEETKHRLDKAEHIYFGRKMEQAGRVISRSCRAYT